MSEIGDEDLRRALLSEHNIDQNDQLQYDEATTSSIIEDVVIRLLTEKEQELMRTLEAFDAVLSYPSLSDTERNAILSGQTDCFHQLELLHEQKEELRPQEYTRQEDDYAESQEDDVHQYLEDQQLEEQIREISEFEAMQQGERLSVAMAQQLTEMSSRPTARPTNRNKLFMGHILNPNQDEADDSPSTPPSSPGSTTSILSADFGDEDVLPIEETACVICQADYRHGDEILRNANCCRPANTSTTSNFQNNSAIAIMCNHVFHTECIKSWIERSGKSDCPCCRSPFALTVSP